MYKNFNLTESEKEEILNKHKSFGYKKPLTEQFNDGEEMDEPDTDGETPSDEFDDLNMDNDTPPRYTLHKNVHIDVTEFTLFVENEEDNTEAWVKVRVSDGKVYGIKVFPTILETTLS